MTKERWNKAKQAAKAAFPHTIPVLTGYLFMGMAFGMLLQSKGYGVVWAFLMALLVYAGSGQFVAVSLMATGFNPLGAFALTLMVNARHIFYGLSMLERFKGFGKSKLYMIFSLTDETFALLASAKPPEEVGEQSFSLAIALLDQLYWVVGCTAGSLIGSALPINTQGIDFVMTALFVVIFLEQWQKRRNRLPAAIGLVCSLVCRLAVGPQWFILASMVLLVLTFTLLRAPMEGQVGPT